MRAAVTLTVTELRRFLRDRSNLFFVLALPLLLVVFIGAQFGGETGTPVAVVAPDDGSADELVAELAALEALQVERRPSVADAEEAVRRGQVAAAVVVADDAAAGAAPVGFLSGPSGAGAGVRGVVEAVVAERALRAAATAGAAEVLGRPPEDSELGALVEQLGDQVPRVAVRTVEVGEGGLEAEFAGLGQFDLGASTQLFLFVFLTSLTASAALIQTRQLGVAARLRTTPVSGAALLVGLGGGRLLVALFQAAYLVVATRLLFGVDWGDPLAMGAVIVLFSLVATGAAMIVGSVFRNDSQAGGIGVGLGLVLAALGGSMVPLEVFPDGARRVAMLTPHAWANTATAELVRRDGTIVDVATELGVLGLYAAVTLLLGGVLLRRALARGA